MGHNISRITYSISLLFDNTSASFITKIINDVASITNNNYHLNNDIPPHITIGMFKSNDEHINAKDTLISCLSPLLDSFNPFQLVLSHIDTFKDKVLIGTFLDIASLKILNEKVYSLLKDNYSACCNKQYVPNTFFPHITFATGLSNTQLKGIKDYCHFIELPKIIKIQNIVIAIKSPYSPFYIK